MTTNREDSSCLALLGIRSKERKMATWFRVLSILLKELTCQFTTVCNTSLREPNTLLWPMWALHSCNSQTYMEGTPPKNTN